MLIGLTYDLRSEYLALGYSEDETAEFDREDTIEALEAALGDIGHTTERIGNVRQLVHRLASGHRWELVFNIAEGLHGLGREAQVPALLEAFAIPYTFSDPLVMGLTLHKGLTKRVLRDAGIPTTDFVIFDGSEASLDVPFAPPYFAKPVAEGTGKGISARSVIRRSEDLLQTGREMLHAFGQPVIVEPYLPGREFTVGVLGTGPRARVLGTVEIRLLGRAEKNVYSYLNKEFCEERVAYDLVGRDRERIVREIEEIALASWRALGCRDAGRVDLRCDADGRPQFMEVNPLAGLHPAHSDLPIICSRLGMAYTDLIAGILASARERLPQQTVRSGLVRRCA
jgi:D-alanine-D-alanine ligase